MAKRSAILYTEFKKCIVIKVIPDLKKLKGMRVSLTDNLEKSVGSRAKALRPPPWWTRDITTRAV